MVLKSAPNRNDAGAWARSHLQAPITYQSVRAQSALRITDNDNAASHTKLLSAHFRTSTVFCPPTKWDRRSGECFWRSDSPGDIARHMRPDSFSLFLTKERRWINCVRQGSTVMQIGNFRVPKLSLSKLYTKCRTFIVNANFICMLIKNQLPWQPETFMRGFRFRSSFDLRPK